MTAPIGIFDSGVGGLTVLRAVRAAMPEENFIYLGDTARLPYGTKSAETVVRYSLQCASALIERGVRCLVVACNTVSASVSQHIAVIATEGPIAEAVARRYLDPIFQSDEAPDTLVLGCTHFPALAGAISAVLPPHVTIVDPAAGREQVWRDRRCDLAGDGRRGTIRARQQHISRRDLDPRRNRNHRSIGWAGGVTLIVGTEEAMSRRRRLN